IVAIHGLDTESPRTWMAWKQPGNPSAGQVHWLRDREMLPSVVPNARILTYDWNAAIVDSAADILLGHADGLLDRLHESSDRPIVFIASCFGGLLLAKALHRAQEVPEYRGILRSTVGIAFLGTPFRGAHESFCTANQLRISVAMQASGEASSDLIRYLQKDNGGRELDESIQRFCEMVENEEYKFPMVCFYETQRTDFTKVLRHLPPQIIESLDSNHTGIVRFATAHVSTPINSLLSLSRASQHASKVPVALDWTSDILC
ncbi:hypothetical protein GQ53DRAFT_669415, partial [Thozetella sp. PMI_491]